MSGNVTLQAIRQAVDIRGFIAPHDKDPALRRRLRRVDR
jgi:hypothetical protein